MGKQNKRNGETYTELGSLIQKQMKHLGINTEDLAKITGTSIS